MKLHKILPIIFLIIAMIISCSQETVINENISGEATTPDTKICVNIKTENSRTVRPEITKWEITVTNKSDANLTFSRTIDGKATSATFVNVTDGEYEITVRGFNKDNKIILKNGSNSFYIKPNTVNVCEIIPEDNFDTSTRKGILDITVKISGLKDLFSDDKTIIAKITNNSESKSIDLYFNSEKTELTGEITEIIPGSYKIEISNSKNLNLVKDPVVNIYPETTTEINWEWNYDSDEINTDQELKGIKIPVWNKSVFNPDLPEESSVPAKNGSLSANALFAEPIWDEFYEFKSLMSPEDKSIHDVTIDANEFDFINCAYDNAGTLWVLSYADGIEIIDDTGTLHTFSGLYVLKNLSTDEDYKFIYTDSLKQDFTVATIKEKKYLFSLSASEQNRIAYAELKKDETVEITNFFEDTGLSSNLGNITTLYISRNSNTDEIPIYIAITSSDDNGTTANIYTGTISTGDTITFDIDTDKPLLSLGISNFTATIQNSEFSSNAFMISDMYINEDKSKLYVTAGCVSYDGNSWNNNQDYGVYHSFGGLFVYELEESGNLAKDVDGSITVESYGINQDEDESSPFLKESLTAGGDGFELESNIMQAESETSSYFAGPRYIIPSGNDLLIVDSGFYGVYEYQQLINCEKRNRIFTFNIKEINDESEGLIFNSLTTLDDSISFDYDYLTSSSRY